MFEFAEVLRNRAFRSIWTAGLFSATGTEISRLTLFLYLFSEQDSVLVLALFVALRTLPGMLAAPVTGCLVDRLSKRSVMVSCDVVRALFVLIILLRPTTAVICLMSALDSVLAAAFEPAKKSSIALVVPKRDLFKANGLGESASNLTMIAGPLIGAELFVRSGLLVAMLVDALSFLVSAWLISRIRVPEHPAASSLSTSAISGEIRAGWRYLLGERVVLRVVVLLFVSIVCGGIWIPLAPFFIRDFLGGPEQLLGWQISTFGVGGIVGGILAPKLSRRLDQGVLLALAFLVEALHLTAYSLIFHPLVSTITIFSWGIAVSVIGVCSLSILQIRVREQFLGRIFSIVKQGENCGLLLAMLVATGLSTFFSSRVLFLMAGIVYAGMVAAVALTAERKAEAGGRALPARSTAPTFLSNLKEDRPLR